MKYIFFRKCCRKSLCILAKLGSYLVRITIVPVVGAPSLPHSPRPRPHVAVPVWPRHRTKIFLRKKQQETETQRLDAA
jgi:hypothetical protein